jgi:putative hemolysin
MKRIVFVLLLSLLILAACGPEPTAVPPTAAPTAAAPTAAPTEAVPAVEPTEDTTFESPLDMANPASVFCEEQGYTLEIRDEEGGQVGYCIFPNGAECEEWAFYRGECTVPETYP